MANSVSPNETGMAALIGKNSIQIEKINRENNLNLEIANDNSPIQIVISGMMTEITKNKNLFLNNGVKKFIILNVSAAFHSKYMLQAQKELSEEIELLNFSENKIRIISNFDAKSYENNEIIKKNLQKQMANRVNWTQSVKTLESLGENNIIEIGPSKVLSGLINRISKILLLNQLIKFQICNMSELKKFLLLELLEVLELQYVTNLLVKILP